MLGLLQHEQLQELRSEEEELRARLQSVELRIRAEERRMVDSVLEWSAAHASDALEFPYSGVRVHGPVRLRPCLEGPPFDLDRDEPVTLLGYVFGESPADVWFLIEQDGRSGFAEASPLWAHEVDPDLVEHIADAVAARRESLRRAWIVANHDPETAIRLVRREVWLGMSEAEAIDGFGAPITRRPAGPGLVVLEAGRYLLFENGRLILWQPRIARPHDPSDEWKRWRPWKPRKRSGDGRSYGTSRYRPRRSTDPG